MSIRKTILAAALAAVAGFSQAGSSASVTCGNAPVGVHHNGQLPVLNVSYTPGVDAGSPGLFWFGILTPDQEKGAVLTPQGWMAYQGGEHPFQARYEGGIPAAITLALPFPSDGRFDTSGFIGYRIYAGHGVYTKQAQQAVATRRAMLDTTQAQRVAAGTWQADYETDESQILSVIQKNMVDTKKFGPLLTVPYIDCALRN